MDTLPPGEKKPAEAVPAAKPAPEAKATEQKATEAKPVEQPAPPVKTAEEVAAEQKAAEERLAARKEEERKAAIQKALDKEYLEAAKRGNLKELKELLGKGANLLANDDGNTALFYAAQHGRMDAVVFLLHSGIPLNVKNRIGSTALTAAAAGGHKEVALLLYDLGLDPAEKNLAGTSSLKYARNGNYTDLIELLSKPRNVEEVIFTRQAGDRTLQEIFNFATKERLTFIRKDADSTVEAIQRDSFDDLTDKSGLRKAFDAYKQKGGKRPETDFFPAPPPPAAEPPKPKKSRLKFW